MSTVKPSVSKAHRQEQGPSPSSINTVAAQDVKRRGVGAIVEKLETGPVHVFQRNRPAFVAMREEHYQELLAEVEDARLRASLADVEAGRVRFASPSELIEEILDIG